MYQHSIDTQYHIIDRNQLYPFVKVEFVVDFGVRSVSNLTFRDHISEKNKAHSVIGIIKRNFICMFEHTLYYFVKQ